MAGEESPDQASLPELLNNLHLINFALETLLPSLLSPEGWLTALLHPRVRLQGRTGDGLWLS